MTLPTPPFVQLTDDGLCVWVVLVGQTAGGVLAAGGVLGGSDGRRCTDCKRSTWWVRRRAVYWRLATGAAAGKRQGSVSRMGGGGLDPTMLGAGTNASRGRRGATPGLSLLPSSQWRHPCCVLASPLTVAQPLHCPRPPPPSGTTPGLSPLSPSLPSRSRPVSIVPGIRQGFHSAPHMPQLPHAPCPVPRICQGFHRLARASPHAPPVPVTSRAPPAPVTCTRVSQTPPAPVMLPLPPLHAPVHMLPQPTSLPIPPLPTSHPPTAVGDGYAPPVPTDMLCDRKKRTSRPQRYAPLAPNDSRCHLSMSRVQVSLEPVTSSEPVISFKSP